MTHWWLLAILSGVGLAGRNVFFKMSSDRIDGALAALALSLSMSVMAIAYYLYQRMADKQPIIPAEHSLQGIGLSCLAGLSLAVANIFLAYTYKAGGGAGLTGVLQNGVSIGFTILIGVLLLNETIRPMQAAGIAASLIGIMLIVKG